MRFNEALKMMRKELSMTQVELAKTLGVYCASVSRWESGKNTPHTKTIEEIIKIAKSKGASPACINQLQKALSERQYENVRVSDSHLYPVERESICQLIDDASNVIIVADIETNELLYANHKAEEMFGHTFQPGSGLKCHEFTEKSPGICSACRKEHLGKDVFSERYMKHPTSGLVLHVQGRIISWNGRNAHVEYITVTGMDDIPAEKERIFEHGYYEKDNTDCR